MRALSKGWVPNAGGRLAGRYPARLFPIGIPHTGDQKAGGNEFAQLGSPNGHLPAQLRSAATAEAICRFDGLAALVTEAPFGSLRSARPAAALGNPLGPAAMPE